MEIKVDDILIGKVNQIRPYALFLTFENGQRGLLHISELSDNYIRDIEKYGSVGDEIKVKVLSIDPSNGFLRVSYKAIPEAEIDPSNGFLRVSYKAIPEAERYNSHDDSKQLSAQFDEADFHDLEEKLPEWISETLEKIKEENKDD